MFFLFINVHKQNEMTYPGWDVVFYSNHPPGEKFFKTLLQKSSYVNTYIIFDKNYKTNKL